MIRSYFWKIVLGVIIGTGLALGISLIAPKKYEGFVQILIDQKQQTPGVAMSAAEKSTMDVTDFYRPRSLTTQVQQLTGFDVLKEAGEKVKTELNVPTNDQDELSPISTRENVFVDAELGSDIVTVRVRMSSAEKASTFAREMYLAYVRNNNINSLSFANQALGQIKEAMDGLKTQMDEIDKKLQETRVNSGITDPGTQLASDYGAMLRAKEARDTAAVELETLKGRLVQLEAEFPKLSRDIKSSEATMLNQNVLSLEANLAASRSERAGLVERYYEDHEQVKRLDATIKRLDVELKATKERLKTSETTSINPNYQSMQADIAQTKAAVTASERKLAEADVNYQASAEKLKAYPEVSKEFSDLARQAASLERLYSQYSEQYRALELSKRGRVTPTTLITNATALPDPVSPKPLQNSVIGGLVGLLIAGLICARREATRMPIRSLAQLNALSSITAYRTVPKLGVPFRGLNKAPHESYETMVLNCLRSESRPYRVAIFGIIRDSGASTAAMNYALSVQRRGLKSLIVMADPRSIVRRVSKQVPGAGQVGEVTDGVRVLNATEMNLVEAHGTHLDIAGAVKEHEADVTIFDLDFTLRSADYAILSQVIDEAILLVRADRVRSVDFATVQQALKDAGCKQVTVILSFASSDATTLDRIEVVEENKALPE